MLSLLAAVGCGGGGSGSSSGGEGPVSAVLIAAKLAYEGSSDKDAIFVSISGSGVTGGRLIDPLSQPIIGSDLVFENATNQYQRQISSTGSAFRQGEYILQYYQNGNTLEYKSKPLAWTNIQGFTSSVTQSWDPFSHYLSVSAPTLPGNVKYFLELYNADTGTLRRQTQEFINPSAISEYISEPGNFRIALIANFYENGVLKEKSIFYFKDTVENSIRKR